MKAGKSTLINAIVGSGLLPARAEAMTTLPTKIVLVDELDEPELTISDPDRTLFAAMVEELQGQVLAQYDQLADKYAHLEPLLTSFKHGLTRPVERSWRGRDTVLEGLKHLNDLLRLAAIVRPETDYIGQLSELPTLRTPFWMRPELVGTDRAGTLAMIDTPGPDESGLAARLVGVVAAQLKSSHVVVLLLDYTAMGREADETVRGMVEPIVRQIGRHKLYVVVNKVDQRRAGDRDVDAVRRFVQRDLDLVDAGADERIVEAKGQQALAAAGVLSGYPRSGGSTALRDVPEVRALLNELFTDPEDRQHAIVSWTESQLLARAERVWQGSGLPRLLDHVIARLRASAVPVVLTSALDKAGPQLTSLREIATLRLRATRADGKRVAAELAALKQEKQELARVRAEAPEASALGDSIETDLREKLDSFRVIGTRMINKVDGDVADAVAAEESRAPVEERSPFGILGRMKSQLGDAAHALLTDRRSRPGGVIEFDTAEAANAFIHDVERLIVGQLQRGMDYMRKDLNATAHRRAAQVVAEQNSKVQPLVERAARRLAEQFDLTLTVPPLQLTDGDIEVEPLLSTLEESHQTKERRRTEKRRRWYVLWLVKVSVTVPETYDEVTRVHLVDVPLIKSRLTAGFESRLAVVRNDVKLYMVEHLVEELKDYFNGVDAYLSRYTQSLEQAQKDARQDGEKRAETAQRLDGLVEEAVDHLHAVAALKSRLAG